MPGVLLVTLPHIAVSVYLGTQIDLEAQLIVALVLAAGVGIWFVARYFAIKRRTHDGLIPAHKVDVEAMFDDIPRTLLEEQGQEVDDDDLPTVLGVHTSEMFEQLSGSVLPEVPASFRLPAYRGLR